MDQKNAHLQEEPDQTAESQEATEQELEQVAGGREPTHVEVQMNNPLYGGG